MGIPFHFSCHNTSRACPLKQSAHATTRKPAAAHASASAKPQDRNHGQKHQPHRAQKSLDQAKTLQIRAETEQRARQASQTQSPPPPRPGQWISFPTETTRISSDDPSQARSARPFTSYHCEGQTCDTQRGRRGQGGDSSKGSVTSTIRGGGERVSRR